MAQRDCDGPSGEAQLERDKREVDGLMRLLNVVRVTQEREPTTGDIVFRVTRREQIEAPGMFRSPVEVIEVAASAGERAMTPCEHVRHPDGTVAILCSRGRKYPRCGQPGCTNRADLLCDYPVASGKTCDARICNDHAKEVGPNKHVCPAHVDAATQEQLL